MNVLPRPSRLWTSIVPSCCSTMRRAPQSPGPVPRTFAGNIRRAVDAFENVPEIGGGDADASVSYLDDCGAAIVASFVTDRDTD